MAVSYSCPNPECGVTLKTAERVAVGKSVKCPKCARPFVPEPGEKQSEEGTLKLVEEPKPAANQAAAGYKDRFGIDDEEDQESINKGYGVVAETEEEKERAEQNRPKFTEVQDKFKKSSRGPAMSLLVMPSNLLTLAGLVTCAGGLGAFIWGMWPLVFNDAPPGEEELEEAIVMMVLGVCVLFWGAMVCFGASQMQELGSYPWAMVGSVMGIATFFVGIYAIIMLQNPKVKAGFEEGAFVEEGGEEEDEDKEQDEDEEDEEDEDEEDEDEEDEEDEDEDVKKKPGKKSARNRAKRRRADDDEDEDEDEE